PILTNVKNSVIDILPFQTITLEEANADDVLFSISWSPTELYLDDSDQAAAAGPVSYTVEVARQGTDFETPEIVAVTPDLHVELTTTQLNNLLKSKFYAQASTPIDVEFRVLAKYGQNIPASVASGNTVFLTVTVFEAADVMQPLYLLGDMNGWR